MARMCILPGEQKALRRGTRGCLDALIVDEAVSRETWAYKRNLSMAWIDFRKAFHEWLEVALQTIRAPIEVAKLLGKLIPKWQTTVPISSKKGAKSFTVKLMHRACVLCGKERSGVSKPVPGGTCHPPGVCGRREAVRRDQRRRVTGASEAVGMDLGQRKLQPLGPTEQAANTGSGVRGVVQVPWGGATPGSQAGCGKR